jgi:MFS family permease
LRTARLSVFGAFVINGILLAMWIVNIPSVERDIGISHATLGVLLLLIGLGAFIGMQLAGALVDRIGSKHTTLIGAAGFSTAALLPGLATEPVGLGGALFAMGLGTGVLDVAMNAQAVTIQQAYGRPIMSAFHAFYSIGGAVGALIGALLISLGWGVLPILVTGACLGGVLTAASYPGLVPRARADELAAEREAGLEGGTGRSRGRTPARLIWLLGSLAFLLMLVEGTANDWSTLQITERLGPPAAVAAIGYAAFGIAMTVGRLTTDRIVARFGAVRVVRYGSLVAFAGLLTIVLSGELWVTVSGWAVLGLGLSGTVPQIFTAAGDLTTGKAGTNLARVVGMGYVGLLAGPAIIGGLAELTSVNIALILPLVLIAVVVVLAPVVGVGGPIAPPRDERLIDDSRVTG